MSLARNLVDLYMLGSAVTKVSSCIVTSQTSAVCHHVKTSSIFNPIPNTVDINNHQPKDPQEQTTTEPTKNTAIEVPFPEIIKDKSPYSTTYDHEHSTPGMEILKTEPSINETTPPLQSQQLYSTNNPTEISKPVNQQSTTNITEPNIIEVPVSQSFVTTEIEKPTKEDFVKEIVADTEVKRKVLKESRIPTSRFSRLWNYGTLATSMGIGALNESLKRATGLSQDTSGSVVLSESNVNRLVEKLSRMRGAALKMGQMLSIQGIQASNDGSSGLPPQLEQVLLRVHDSANYMPRKQMEKVMTKELGSDWKSYFKDFDPIPIAAASIGQVHAATLASTNEPVVIKIQYPGVKESIDSDLSNLKALVTFSNLLPRGLYLDNTIKVTKEELAWECDYIREANNAIRFKKLLEKDNRYKVPHVVKDLCTERVLVTERLKGQVLSRAIDESQEIRNNLGESLLRLCLREVFSFKFMQTDPNWSNFFYNKAQIELLDFGACREFPEQFLQKYGRILISAAHNDRDGVWKYSEELGFVTGYETEVMRNAHIDSVMVLGEPFKETAPDQFDFSNQTITKRVRETIPVMLRHRLTPPPDETYGLHKKLSGAFLLCTKLRSQFDTKKVWREEVENHFKM